MSKENVALLAFKRCQLSPLALARVDVKHVGLSAATQTNWMPRTLGSMMLRPGTGYIATTLNGAQAIYLPFIFNNSDTALLEITNNAMRVLVDETPLTRVQVGTNITNASFSGDLSGWTNADQSGAASVWVSGNYMGLTGTLSNAAIRKQTVTVAAADLN